MLPINGDIVVVEENDLLRQIMADILAGIRARVILFEKADDTSCTCSTATDIVRF